MKKALLAILIILGLYPTNCLAQDKKDAMDKALTAYFALDRENIHVHLDKNIFLAGEETWFRGYVLQRKLKLPNQTTNVYGALIDETGKVLKTDLFYCVYGDFAGNIKLDKNLPSGKYYLQFYTNWMNNFTEDESSVYEISVLNRSDKGLQKVSDQAANIEFFPEGGALIRNVKNNVVVKVSGCGRTKLPVTSLEIKNGKGEVVKTVPLNKYGYGKFDLVPNDNSFKASVKVNDKVHEQALPLAQVEGIALEVNNYSLEGKVILKARISEFSKGKYAGKPLYVLIHQDDRLAIYNLEFPPSGEATMMLPDTDIFGGTNIIRIIDDSMNQVAERVIFQHPGVLDISEIAAKPVAGDIEVSGKMNNSMVTMSASVLPENTKTLASGDNLYSSLLLSPYIKNSKQHADRYFFENTGKSRQYELDMYLSCQYGKYRWADIMGGAPAPRFNFDRGLTVKAKLPANHAKNKNLVIRLTYVPELFQKTLQPDANGEVVYEELILQDSTRIGISVLEKREPRKDIKPTVQIINGLRTYNKMYKPEMMQCTHVSDDNLSGQDMPVFAEDVINLEEVVIEESKKDQLKYQHRPGNLQLRAYKITAREIASSYYLLDFIRFHGGFDVQITGSDVSITGRARNSIQGAGNRPMVYLNNMILMDFGQLFNIPLEEVDEVYMNANAVVPSINNTIGIIRIYMKSNYTSAKSASDPGILVNDGFAKTGRFKADQYASTSGKGFENFGIIDWESKIYTNQQGEFNFRIPHTTQKTIKVLFEGFSADGKLISEVKTINLN